MLIPERPGHPSCRGAAPGLPSVVSWMDILEFPALKLLVKGDPGRAGAHMEAQELLGHSSEQEELLQFLLVLPCSGHTGVF